jgi:hypothetical protein
MVAIGALFAHSQATRGTLEREFPFSVPVVKAALENIGAYSGSRLPSLEGFANLERVNLKDYQRPYYEFKIELEPTGQNHTRVKLSAHVSAWYTGPDAAEPGYRSLESNGHLENDLFDRLSDYLRDKSADAATLEQWIATAKKDRADAERHTSELQDQMKKLENPQSPEASYVAVAQPHLAVLSSPSDSAAPVLKAQMDDEFEVLERRGAWLRVKIDEGGSGWVKASQVQNSDVMPAKSAQLKNKAMAEAGFEVIRENTDDFNGDWARLKGKKALYVWARPNGSAMSRPMGNRLQFVQRLFTERYRVMAHSSQGATDGIVIIFLDDMGGVAAATLDDIRLWVEGSLNQASFLKRCSLDPPGAFQEPSPTPPLKQPAGASAKVRTEAPPAP